MPNTRLRYSTSGFHTYVGKDEGVFLELLNVIENVSDQVNRHLVDIIKPVLNDSEYVFARVSLADILYNIVRVSVVDAKLLDNFSFIFHLFHEFLVYNFH